MLYTFPCVVYASHNSIQCHCCAQVAWNDDEDVSKGYKYLYLSEPDANLFKPGTDFHGEWLDVPGEGKRCASTRLGF